MWKEHQEENNHQEEYFRLKMHRLARNCMKNEIFGITDIIINKFQQFDTHTLVLFWIKTISVPRNSFFRYTYSTFTFRAHCKWYKSYADHHTIEMHSVKMYSIYNFMSDYEHKASIKMLWIIFRICSMFAWMYEMGLI